MITIAACGFCIDNGQPTQRGGAAVKLALTDEIGRAATRAIISATGNSTQPQSDLKAVLLGLHAISPQFTREPIRLCASKYASKVLERQNGKFKTSPQKNVELVEKVRAFFLTFPNIELVVDVESQKTALQLAKEVAETQESDDSGTVVEEVK